MWATAPSETESRAAAVEVGIEGSWKGHLRVYFCTLGQLWIALQFEMATMQSSKVLGKLRAVPSGLVRGARFQSDAAAHRANPLNPSPPPAQTDPLAGPSNPSSRSRTTHFGFQEVPESLKESLVGSVFTSVSPKYDLLNDSMSLGIHRLWKDSFVSSMLPRLPPSLHESTPNKEWTPAFQCLDVAGGTGDIALRILDRAREKYGNRDVRVEIVDINEGMLTEGRKRVAKTLYYNSEIRVCRGPARR